MRSWPPFRIAPCSSSQANRKVFCFVTANPLCPQPGVLFSTVVFLPSHFDKVLETNPQGEYTEDAAYASVLCYNKQYQSTFAESEKTAIRNGLAGPGFGFPDWATRAVQDARQWGRLRRKRPRRRMHPPAERPA